MIPHFFNQMLTLMFILFGLIPVVQRLDNTIQISIQWICVNKTNHANQWMVIYVVDNIIEPSTVSQQMADSQPTGLSGSSS